MKLSARTAAAAGWALFGCAVVAFAAMAGLEIAASQDKLAAVFLCLGALAATALLRLPDALHETGHLLFGVCAGLRVLEVRIGWLCFDKTGVRFAAGKGAGETRLTLRHERGARARLFAAALGGPLLAAVAGVALLLAWGMSAAHPALTFFALTAPFLLQEALFACVPAELPDGATDGLTLAELASKTGEAEVALRVMTAQLQLERDPNAELPYELLFGAPVVREDSPAFLELLRLQREYLLAHGERAEAERIGARLQAIVQEQGG